MENDFNFDNPQRWTLVPASSNILAIQYTAGDPLADLGTLRIRFHSGAEYSYDKVPNQLAVDFFESESKGKFFHTNISRVYEGVRNLNNELQADLEERLEAKVKEGALDKLLEDAPVPEDVPIEELFSDSFVKEPVTADFVKAVEDSTVTFPVPYRDHA